MNIEDKFIDEFFKPARDFEKFNLPTSEIAQEVGRILQADNPLSVLAADHYSTHNDIRAARNRLVFALHPDRLGDQVGDFASANNHAVQKVNDAYRALKDHTPTPRTFYDAVYQRVGKEEFEQMEPLDQLSGMLNLMFHYANEDTLDNITGGLGAIFAIGRMAAEKSQMVKSIAIAYQEGRKGLPTIDQVIQVLGSSINCPHQTSRIITDEEGFRTKAARYPGWAAQLGFDDPFVWRDYFIFPIPTSHGLAEDRQARVAGGKLDPDSWISAFVRLNKIPVLTEEQVIKKRQKIDGQTNGRGHQRFSVFSGITSRLEHIFRRIKITEGTAPSEEILLLALPDPETYLFFK